MSTGSSSRDHTHATDKINVKTYEPTPHDQSHDGPELPRIHVVEDLTRPRGSGKSFLSSTTEIGPRHKRPGIDPHFVRTRRLVG
jgi:hypothetical protein